MANAFDTVRILGRPFTVDTKRQVFRSQDEPKLSIPFERTLVANHEIHIPFERATGKLYAGNIGKEIFEDKSIRIESLPQRLVFPQVSNDTMAERPRDPMINIYGTIFKLDYRGQKLEEVGKPQNTMLFDDMLIVRNDQLTFWYDQGKKTIFKGSVLELETNPAIIKVQIQPFYRVINLTPVKEEALQTLIDVARALQPSKPADDQSVDLIKPKRKGRRL